MKRLLMLVALALMLVAQSLSAWSAQPTSAEKAYTVRYICFTIDKMLDLDELKSLDAKEPPAVGSNAQAFLDKFEAFHPGFHGKLLVAGAQPVSVSRPSKAEFQAGSADGKTAVSLKDEITLRSSEHFGLSLDVRMELTQFGPEEVVGPDGKVARPRSSSSLEPTISVKPGVTKVLGSGSCGENKTLVVVASFLAGDQVGAVKE